MTGDSPLQERTKQYALRIIRLTQALPPDQVGQVIARQLLRSGTSVGANYRAARRARSKADFIAKMGIVEEELDETRYWMELLVEAGLMGEPLLTDLMREGHELLSMTVASIRTARNRLKM